LTATLSKSFTTDTLNISPQRIGCLEKGQAYGNNTKHAASKLVFGKQVTLQTHGLDKYGRTLGDVFLPDGTNVNHELVKDGWCWMPQLQPDCDT
jgi:micrococcal nuclease